MIQNQGRHPVHLTWANATHFAAKTKQAKDLKDLSVKAKMVRSYGAEHLCLVAKTYHSLCKIQLCCTPDKDHNCHLGSRRSVDIC